MAIRRKLRWEQGAEVEVNERGGVIETVPRPAAVEIVVTDDGLVARPVEDLPVLTDAEVLAALDESRR